MKVKIEAATLEFENHECTSIQRSRFSNVCTHLTLKKYSNNVSEIRSAHSRYYYGFRSGVQC